jgi:hypothetical protein
MRRSETFMSKVKEQKSMLNEAREGGGELTEAEERTESGWNDETEGREERSAVGGR